MNGFSVMSKRMIAAAVVLILGFSYVAFTLYRVQIVSHKELYEKAKKKYTAVRKTSGLRGEIYDVSGNMLVGNIPCSDVCADPSAAGDAEKCMEIAKFLAPQLKLPVREVYDKLMQKEIVSTDKDGKKSVRPKKFVILKGKVDFETAELLKSETTARNWKCIFYRETVKRSYPKKQLLANLLGFTTSDRDTMVPTGGLEKALDKNIRPEEGVNRFERSRDGLPISYGENILTPKQDGSRIYLTIREPIQAILEEELDKLAAQYHPLAAYAIMADPWTGDILAAAQRPTFDPNEREKITPEGWRNRIAEDTFEPGSTMKPIIVAGGLDRGIITPNEKFDCENGFWIYNKKSLKDSHKMGLLTVTEIIQHSSNIGTAKIAIKMGDVCVDQIIREFGIGQRTGIGLRLETRGIYRPLPKWDSLSISRFPIGQGLAVSPLQLVRAYCTLANGGYPLKLKLVDRIEDPETGKVTKIKPEPCIRVFKRPGTTAAITDMMKRVTAPGGTARCAAVKGYYVAGKTGTAQKFEQGELYVDSQGRQRRRKGYYSKKRYIANFIGFVPADRPRFVLLVTADEPKGKSYYGGTVSGPYFRSIAERTLKYMNVPQDYDWEAEEAAAKAARKTARR